MHSLSAAQLSQTFLEATGVVVHVLVAGLHESPAHLVSFAAVHCTHSPEAQTFLPAMRLQSASWAHAVQMWLAHSDLVALGHSVLVLHSTQVLVFASQTGVLPVQATLSLAVHCTQVLAVAAQTGLPDAAVQAAWLLAEHCTQALALTSQTVLSPLQPGAHAGCASPTISIFLSVRPEKTVSASSTH